MSGAGLAKTLRVSLDEVGESNRSILDFFFARLGQQTFALVNSQEQSNALIIDYDYPPARNNYEQVLKESGKPALILSIAPVELDNAIWLAKPLTSRALMKAATDIQPLLSAQPDDDAPVTASVQASASQALQADGLSAPFGMLGRQNRKKTVSEVVEAVPLVESAEQVQEEQPPVANEIPDVAEAMEFAGETPDETDPEDDLARKKREEVLCGVRSDMASYELPALQRNDSFFISSLKDAIQLARQCQQGVMLEFPQQKIYVLPEINRIFCPLNPQDDEFKVFIDSCDPASGGKMHILSTEEVHELNELIAGNSDGLHDLEGFLWVSSLLSAQGTLPRAIGIQQTVMLKHWPGFTRLESVPCGMAIAAQWAYKPASASDLAAELDVPQRYVFSFLNAAYALDLMELEPKNVTISSSKNRTADAPRGLLSRLLKRLIGG